MFEPTRENRLSVIALFQKSDRLELEESDVEWLDGKRPAETPWQMRMEDCARAHAFGSEVSAAKSESRTRAVRSLVAQLDGDEGRRQDGETLRQSVERAYDIIEALQNVVAAAKKGADDELRAALELYRRVRR